MIHAAVFFNNVVENEGNFTKRSSSIENYADQLMMASSMVFIPVFYLFHGNEVTISSSDSHLHVHHEELALGPLSTNRGWLLKTAAVILLVLSLPIGTGLRAVAYLCSKSLREEYSWAVQHYTPVDRVIDLKGNLDIDELRPDTVDLNQPIKNLVIRTGNTSNAILEIQDNPSIIELNAQERIILVGAKIVPGPLDDALVDAGWERAWSNDSETKVQQRYAGSARMARNHVSLGEWWPWSSRIKKIYNCAKDL